MKAAQTVVVVVSCVIGQCSLAVAQSRVGSAGLRPDAPPPPAPPAVESRDAEGHVTLRAVRISEPLTIDGRLDDPWYQSVMPMAGFIQQEPKAGEPTTERTEAWVFYDDENVYVAARCWDSQPDRMLGNEMRHDSSNMLQNEHFAAVIDTFYDRRNGYIFLLNLLGGMLEETFVDERNPSRDWNTVWNGKTSRFEQGWMLEMAIPFKSLRYRPGTSQVWGLNLYRVIRWKNERAFLSPLPASAGPGPFRISYGATLVGIEAPPPSKNLEVKPYAIGGVTTDRRANVNNDRDGDVGFDVKYGVTRGLTADLTYNTDFAQVEEDEQQLNLTRFNLFFPEKREFFLEGQGIFSFAGQRLGASSGATGVNDTPILFFSREIGLHGGRPVPIVAGGRLTGKVGAYSVGAVNIQTGDVSTTAARATNFTVIRVRRDILRRSTIGALFTGRSVSTRADGSNKAFGLDGLFSFYENVRINTYIARTWTPGLAGDDRSYRAEFDYAHDRYGLQLERLAVGEHFNPEVGFLRRRDFRKSAVNLRFSPRPRSMTSVRKFFWEGGYEQFTTGAGRLETRETRAAFRTEFNSSDRFNLEYTRLYELLETPFSIASGVVLPVGGYRFQDVLTSYQLGSQRRVAGTVSLLRGTFYSGHQTAASYRGRIEVTPKVALEPAVSVNRIDLPEGAFTTRLVSTRVTSTITPRMYVGALIQYNSSANALGSSVRFRWEYQPGSELFVVYTDGRDTSVRGFPSLSTRGFVVKMTRLFRL